MTTAPLPILMAIRLQPVSPPSSRWDCYMGYRLSEPWQLWITQPEQSCLTSHSTAGDAASS